MNTYISMLRGINVSGKNKLKMDDLKVMYEKLGYNDVLTYIQSGNVFFKCPETPLEELATTIKNEIANTFGYDVKLFVRTIDQFERIADNHPFQTTGEEPLSQLLVTFLATKPAEELVNAIADFVHKEDQFKIQDDVIYLFCPGGYGKTKLSNNFFERKLKVDATTRNWKSVNKLLELAKSI